MKKLTTVVAAIAAFALTACSIGSSKTIVKTLDPETGKVLTETETYDKGFMESLTDSTAKKIVIASVDFKGGELKITSGTQASSPTPAAEMDIKSESAKYVTIPQDATPEAINAAANLMNAVNGNISVTTSGIEVNGTSKSNVAASETTETSVTTETTTTEK